MTSNQTSLIRGGLWSVFSTSTSILLGLLSSVMLVRLLTPSDLGLYFSVLAAVTLATLIGSLGLTTPINAFVAEADPDSRRSVIARGFLIAAGGTVIVTFLFLVGVARVVEAVVGNTDDVPWWMLALLSAVFIFRGLSADSLVSLAKLRSSSIVRAIPPFVIAVSFLVFWSSGSDLDLFYAFVIVVAANGISVVAAVGLIIRSVGRGGRRRQAPAIRRYLAIGVPWLGTTLLWFAFVQSGVLVVAATSSTAEAAEFGIAMKIATFVALPSAVVNSVIPPFVSRYWVDRDDLRLERLMRATASISGGASAIATIAIIAFGEPLLSITFGDYYSTAWAPMVILSLGFTVDALTGQSAQMMALAGRERLVLYVFLLVSPAALAAMVVLGKMYGSFGVATALAVGVAGSNVASAVVARRSMSISTWASTSRHDAKAIVTDVLKFRRSERSHLPKRRQDHP